MRRFALVWLASVLATWQAEAGTVKLTVEEPSGVRRTGWPVTSGIPFACGALKDDGNVTLLAADGVEIPLQTETLSRWPDGSVRWLSLDFHVDLSGREIKQFSLRHGQEIRRGAIDGPIQVRRESGAVVIDTGPARLRLAPDTFYLPGDLWLDANRDGDFSDEERITDPESQGMALVDGDGRHFYSTAGRAEIAVEQSGPLRACVRVTGHHTSTRGRMFRYVARIHVFRGQPFLRIVTTFINDHQDSLMDCSCNTSAPGTGVSICEPNRQRGITSTSTWCTPSTRT